MAACAGVGPGVETWHLLAPPQSYKPGPLEINIVEEAIQIKEKVEEVVLPESRRLEVEYVGRTLELHHFQMRGSTIPHLELVIWELVGEVLVPVGSRGEGELRMIKLSVTHRVEVPRGR